MQSKVIWGLTWKNSRKVTAFEVALKQSFVLKEYDEHNTEAYFDIENIDERWSWFDEVQFKEFYQGPVPYDVVKNGAYNRMYVNNTFRYHNKLFGDPRIRIVRQNVGHRKRADSLWKTHIEGYAPQPPDIARVGCPFKKVPNGSLALFRRPIRLDDLAITVMYDVS